MRKVIVSNMITLDSFFAGPNGEIDWFVANQEFFEDAVKQLDEIDTILFGRVTYEGMASYWPTADAIADSPEIAEAMNGLQKIVFSKTLDKAEWNNSTLVKGDIGAEITQLKQQAGKDMVIFGSGEIVVALTNLGLIDEYRLFVVPTILGNGKPQFEGITTPVNLKLAGTKTYQTGVVVLTYELAGG